MSKNNHKNNNDNEEKYGKRKKEEDAGGAEKDLVKTLIYLLYKNINTKLKNEEENSKSFKFKKGYE